MSLWATPALAQYQDNEVNHALAEEFIYLDAQNRIRVLDITSTSDEPSFLWRSSSDGWRSFVTGDLNNDGDHEIVAIRGGQDDGTLTIYDPSVYLDSDQILYTTSLIGKPTLIATGNFDLNTPGHEILYGIELKDEDKIDPSHIMRFIFLRNANSAADGRAWVPFMERNFSIAWERISVGNIDQQGVDEFAVINRDMGTIRTYWVSPEIEHFFSLGSDVNPWNDVKLGQTNHGGFMELITVRSSRPSLSSLFTFKLHEGEYIDSYNDRFSPGPHTVFLADINGNGDDEIFMLRNVPANSAGNPPRIIMRNRGGDSINTFELTLNQDNLFTAGVGGDVDGDGKDEVIIVRDTQIRVFTEPDQSNNSHNYQTPPEDHFLRIANLGHLQSEFRVSQTQIEETLVSGTQGAPIHITLDNAINQRTIDFTVALKDSVSWATLITTTNQTPATFAIILDATGLSSGENTTQILVNSSAADTINIDLKLIVESALELQASSSKVAATLASNTQSEPVSFVLSNTRSELPIDFTAILENTPSWATLDVDTGQTPATLQVTFDAANLLPNTYTSRILFNPSTADVVNPDYAIALELIVDSAISTSNHARAFVYDPCEEPLAIMTQTIQVEGAIGLSYTVAIRDDPNPLLPLSHQTNVQSQGLLQPDDEPLDHTWPKSSVPWLEASSENHQTPAEIILRIDPSQRESDPKPEASGNQAAAGLNITVISTEQALTADQSRMIIPIYFICVQHKIYMPRIAR